MQIKQTKNRKQQEFAEHLNERCFISSAQSLSFLSHKPPTAHAAARSITGMWSGARHHPYSVRERGGLGLEAV